MTTLTTPAQHCTIRVTATFIHDEAQYGVRVDYMGAVFLVARRDIIAASDKTSLLIELECTVVRSTGIASYLVSHAGHNLRVHAQQIRFRRFSRGEKIFSPSGRAAIALANTPEHEPVNLRWLDGDNDRVLPECVESEQEHKQRIEARKHPRQQSDATSVRYTWMEAARQ